MNARQTLTKSRAKFSDLVTLLLLAPPNQRLTITFGQHEFTTCTRELAGYLERALPTEGKLDDYEAR